MVFIDMAMLDKLIGVTAKTAIYPDAGSGTPLALLYVGCGLAGEAGETANQLKKVVRDDHGIMTGPRQEKILKELGGTFWYWIRACAEAGLKPSEVVYANLALLNDRQASGLLSGDDPADDTERQPPPGYQLPRGAQVLSRTMIADRALGPVQPTPAPKPGPRAQARAWADPDVEPDHPVMSPEDRQDALYEEAIKNNDALPLPVWWKVNFTATRGNHKGSTMERLFLAHTRIGATQACAKAVRRAQVNWVSIATERDMRLPKSGPREKK